MNNMQLQNVIPHLAPDAFSLQIWKPNFYQVWNCLEVNMMPPGDNATLGIFISRAKLFLKCCMKLLPGWVHGCTWNINRSHIQTGSSNISWCRCKCGRRQTQSEILNIVGTKRSGKRFSGCSRSSDFSFETLLPLNMVVFSEWVL